MEDRGTCQGEIYLHVYVTERERKSESHQGIYTSRCLSLREKVMEEYIYGTSTCTSKCLRERERERVRREGCSLLNQYHHIMRFPILLH